LDYLITLALVAALGGAGLVFTRRRLAPSLDWQEKAGLTLTQYAERLRASAEQIPQPHADVFWDMAEHLERIRAEVMVDQRDLAQARRFIYYHAKKIVELVEKFVALHDKARPEHGDRLKDMATQLHSYREVFARVLRACIDNDFDDMEATMAALDTQLERLAF